MSVIGSLFFTFGILLLCHSLLDSYSFPNDLVGKMEYQLIQIKANVLILGGLLVAAAGEINRNIKNILKLKQQILQEKESNKEKE